MKHRASSMLRGGDRSAILVNRGKTEAAEWRQCGSKCMTLNTSGPAIKSRFPSPVQTTHVVSLRFLTLLSHRVCGDRTA